MIDTDCPPISLAELVQEAELLTRVDRKYLVPRTDLPAVLAGLPAGTRVLEINGRRDFAYRSAYFDTPALHSYLAAARGRRHRFKLRIRSYLDSDLHFFEVKTRGIRGTTTKQRIPYDDEPTLSPSALAYAAEVLGTRLDLAHVLTTRYHRQTFFLPAGSLPAGSLPTGSPAAGSPAAGSLPVGLSPAGSLPAGSPAAGSPAAGSPAAAGGARLTIDTRLVWELPDGSSVSAPDWAIVETKSAAGASTADRLLWSLRHRPRVVSKYGTGLAALRPDLPANRWRPALRMFPADLATDRRRPTPQPARTDRWHSTTDTSPADRWHPATDTSPNHLPADRWHPAPRMSPAGKASR
ncbi:polyphosphate polymerase domain-containing protein [Actinoplanes sp. NPDC049599]|uniref:polyphosphate polymerase domain-containing protein n=1 Tax=Actinoplanes sp. NPDC049599 TaxID=3363903 RepID=UPI0037AC3612